MLAWTIYLSFAGALIEALLPKNRPGLARVLALIVALAGLGLGVAGFAAGMGQGRILIVDAPWIPTMGVHYLLAADGISRVLVLLTGLAAVAGVLFSWNIELRTSHFFAFFLALIGGVYGVFLSFDFFLLFVFYEIAIVPKYFLIAIWGSTRREYAAMKLALYSFVGSAMVLVVLIAAYATFGQPIHYAGRAGACRTFAALPDVGVSADVCRVRNSRGLVAVPHLGPDRSRGRANRCIHAAGRRGHEAGRIRLPARGHGVVSARDGSVGIHDCGHRLMAQRVRHPRRHRHHLRRAGGAGADRFQICHRLLVREPHGIRASGPDDSEPDWP